jgi:AbiV family abortive infection protein
MYKKEKNYNISISLLQKYSEHALQNAQDLLNEAQLLSTHKHYARAYYLACLSLEETGKACLAWSAQGRNLANEGLHKTLKNIFELHPMKIFYAFYCWALMSPKQFTSTKAMPELQLHLISGREKSMYVDVNADNSISFPSKVVRPKAAVDCIDIAHKCFIATKYYIANNAPPKHSSTDDKFFCLKHEKTYAMIQKEDFFHYLIDHIRPESFVQDFIKCVVIYHDNFYCKNKNYNFALAENINRGL